MAIGAKHLDELNRGRRGKKRIRKDKNNQKGILKINLVGENDKHDNEDAVGKVILTFGEITPGINFEIASRPKGVEGDSPVFVRIKEIPAKVETKYKEGVHQIHNCRNLHDNKSTWLPACMPVVIVEQVNH